MSQHVRLGFGMMRLPLSDPEKPALIDVGRTSAMVDTYLEAGGTYFDTAWMYHDGRSEHAVRDALVSRHPRSSFALASKLPLGCFETEEDMRRIFERQFEKCGVEYFDQYLLHNLNAENYAAALRLGAFDFLRDMKRSGRIRRLGFSFHDDAGLLERILNEHPDMEFVQLQINYLDWDDAAIQSRQCTETAQRHDKEIIVMEPQRGGLLSDPPAEIRQLLAEASPDVTPAALAFRFVANINGVLLILSGMSNEEQLRQNIDTFRNLTALSERELHALKQAVTRFRQSIAIPCTACDYCAGCPVNIPISKYFTLYNQNVERTEGWDSELMYYKNAVAQGFGRAEDCMLCRRCEQHCPQHIEISAQMKLVSAQFDPRCRAE